jgi:hypothetical protein
MAKPVILGVDGVPDFKALHHSGRRNEEVQFYAFDVMALAGEDLRALPLSMRKANLDRLARRPDGIFVGPFEQGELGPVTTIALLVLIDTSVATAQTVGLANSSAPPPPSTSPDSRSLPLMCKGPTRALPLPWGRVCRQAEYGVSPIRTNTRVVFVR